ncbi:hypothetical protein ACJX0J_035388 [Zea mays]
MNERMQLCFSLVFGSAFEVVTLFSLLLRVFDLCRIGYQISNATLNISNMLLEQVFSIIFNCCYLRLEWTYGPLCLEQLFLLCILVWHSLFFITTFSIMYIGVADLCTCFFFSDNNKHISYVIFLVINILLIILFKKEQVLVFAEKHAKLASFVTCDRGMKEFAFPSTSKNLK